MTATWVWLATSIIGIVATVLYVANVAVQLSVARAERLSLQQPQLWGQLLAGGLIGTRMVLSTLLGLLVLADAPGASTWFTALLSAGNVLTVAAVIVLIVALNWTVHEDDETASNAITGAPNALKANAENKVVVEVTGVALEAQVNQAPPDATPEGLTAPAGADKVGDGAPGDNRPPGG